MRRATQSLPTLGIAAGLILAVLLSVVGYHVLQWRIPSSSEALLEQADEKSWVNNWIASRISRAFSGVLFTLTVHVALNAEFNFATRVVSLTARKTILVLTTRS